ncbi:hypothetical protein Bcon01_71690 [Burkholderia contaminans]|nr:hypothetical protein Bcon01_71690 [Burkholderia contaminans]
MRWFSPSKPCREPGQQESKDIAKVVCGVCEQSDGVRRETIYNLCHHETGIER